MPSASASGSAPAPPAAPAKIDPSKLDPTRILNLNVGVLGHVDSGKTSLVKTLSTLLSTASLDKSSQSRQRGITLDLGFSAFLMAPVPERIASDERYMEVVDADEDVEDGKQYDEGKEGEEVDAERAKVKRRCKYDALQITLVDCPGHASLIRTIIGGAQIIDMVLLVIDANKGIQTQTAECIVIAEMTCRDMIVVLNKIDLLGNDDDAGIRDDKLREVEGRVRSVLRKTKFRDCDMVGVSACVGGEKVAAVTLDGGGGGGSGGGGGDKKGGDAAGGEKSSSSSAAKDSTSGPGSTIPTHNIDGLLQLLTSTLRPPTRDDCMTTPFRFSVDHCFPIRGQGTVLTGTVLSGALKVGEEVEFPTLGALQRKVKSMQMFRRKVGMIRQGDRAGICIANFDPNLMERGIASSPGTVKLIDGAIAVVRKVRYFRGQLTSGSKFHVSVGHSTVMATVTFWGAHEICDKLKRMQNQHQNGGGNGAASGSAAITANEDAEDSAAKSKRGGSSSKKGGGAADKSIHGSSSLGGDADVAGLPHLEFDYDEDFVHQDGYLETLEEDDAGNSGPTGLSSDNDAMPLHWALLHFHTPVYCPLDSLVIGSRLDTDINVNTCRLAFSGRLVERYHPKKDADRIRVYTKKERSGVVCRLGDPHRREDDGRVIRYEVYGSDLFKKETDMTQFVGMKIETDKGDIGSIHSSFGTSGKFKVFFPGGTDVREGDKLHLRFKRYANDPKKAMHQDAVLPKERVGARLEPTGKKKKKKGKGSDSNAKQGGANSQAGATAGGGADAAATASKISTGSISTSGEIVSLKGEAVDGKHEVVIVAGFFSPEVNIRDHVGRKVKLTGDDGITGEVAGPFGKAGKCKVSFEGGLAAEGAVGKKLELLPP
mmetsp:Transcript_38449/g.83528  ORF Transcript_38449/g.83528 Transcript_38449/m.83528 type:complete len:881 (-) Transcript_38449:134-2776(-)